MMRVLVIFGLVAVCRAADAQSFASVQNWVESQGGFVERDAAGRIVEVSLAGTWATDRDLDRLLEIKTLRRLDLGLTYVSDRGIQRLRTLENLEELDLDTAEVINDAAIAYLRASGRLRRLNLRGTEITDASLQYISGLTALQSLNIAETQITDLGMEHLAALTNLEEVNLGGDQIGGAGFDVLKLLPKLKKLSLSGVQRLNAGVCWAPVVTDAELDTIALLTALEELNIGWGIGLGMPDPALYLNPLPESECHVVGGIRVTDLGIAKLGALKRLRRLDVSGSMITAAGLVRLSELPRLERLRLWHCGGLDDSAGPALAKLGEIASLDLSNTRVGDEALRRLAALPKLRRLYLTDTQVTPKGLAAARSSMRGVSISWTQRPKEHPPSPGLNQAAGGGH